MDKPYYDPTVPSMYDEGYRAYQHDGLAVYFKNGVYHSAPISVSKLDWHALRAYQDEERKKGVHIRWDQPSMQGKKTADFAVVGISRGNSYLMPAVVVNPVYDRYGTCTAGSGWFVNFRWRAGYPKKGIGGIVPRIEDAQL